MLEQTGSPKLSMILLEQQLAFLGVLARRPDTCPVKFLVFDNQLFPKPSNLNVDGADPDVNGYQRFLNSCDRCFVPTKLSTLAF